MSMRTLPETSAGFADATWESLSPWYQELQDAPLSAATRDEWLARWSRLDALVMEAASLALIAYTCDTNDSAKEAAHRRFSMEIIPQLEESEVGLAKRLVEVGIDRADMQPVLKRFRSAIEIFREANVPLVAEAEGLATQYQQVTGTMTAPWEGEQVPLPRLTPFLKSQDRSVREAAWRASTAPYVAARDEMATIFSRMVELRNQMAANAGFDNYVDYIFAAKCRFDYTPADVLQLQQSIATVVGPAIERALESRRERLGLDTVRPWDLMVDPWRREASVPFRDAEELQEVAARIFEKIDPALGGEFRTMIDEKLLDLESRPGKAPGGYCDTLHARGRPFIFMNAAGVPEDVNTLMHEAGHSFHAFSSHAQPFIWQRHPSSEAAELASMSMELLSAPHFAKPVGYYEEPAAISARLEHLEDVLITLAHIASIDAFQTWIYTHAEGGDADARDAAWLEIRARFEPGVDWSGLQDERVARWYRQLHVFLYPFYYIEYAIAQIGALQVWRNARKDAAEAVAAYRRFLALGATRPLPELYEAAGVRFAFDAGLLKELVDLVEEEMGVLRGKLL
ncbi:MAG: M3 family oligoendopeptidase [Gemmatimonadota bacterium]